MRWLEVSLGGLFVSLQILHIALYSGFTARTNHHCHVVVLIAYVLFSAWMFNVRWRRVKDEPPPNLGDD